MNSNKDRYYSTADQISCDAITSPLSYMLPSIGQFYNPIISFSLSLLKSRVEHVHMQGNAHKMTEETLDTAQRENDNSYYDTHGELPNSSEEERRQLEEGLRLFFPFCCSQWNCQQLTIRFGTSRNWFLQMQVEVRFSSQLKSGLNMLLKDRLFFLLSNEVSK